MSNFDPNAILRGAQLTLVGAHRALQNPGLFTSTHYRQAALAVAAGIAIRIVIAIPILLVRALVWLIALLSRADASEWDHDVAGGVHFIEHSVLQVPFFLMSLIQYITPTLDQMFMESLDWVDRTYVQKHKTDDPHSLRAMYCPNMKQYPAHGVEPSTKEKKSPREAIALVLIKFARRAGISLAVFGASYLPVVGRFVLPAASFYTFRKAVGTQPAVVIFGTSLFFPKKYLVMFLQSYFSSRSLMRELLEPYFSRIKYTKEQKKRWFKDREGVLFGFGVGFFILIKIPLIGVLVYGIAEASTAYLITKITDPPPPAAESKGFAESQTTWTNKHEFLNLSLASLDAHNGDTTSHEVNPFYTEMPTKKFS